MSLPRPILWVGPVDGAIAKMLREFPHAGIFAPGQGSEIAEWLTVLKTKGAVVPAAQVFDPAAHRTASLAEWTTIFQTLR